MPLEPLQFIHAANLFLDRQLEETGPIPDMHRNAIEDASLAAFEEIIFACLENQVDFLMLTGNSFIERDQSLRAKAALLNGFRQLEEENIRVFIMPGEADPPDAWNLIRALPKNVTIFRHRTEEPVAVIRDGGLIATIAQIHPKSPLKDLPSQITTTPEKIRTTPFQIGVFISVAGLFDLGHEDGDSQESEINTWCSDESEKDPVEFILNRFAFDYLAFDEQNRQQTILSPTGIAHSPGSPQGFQMQHTGGRGCTLVTVDEHGEIEIEWIPTSSVRYEQLAIEIESRSDQNNLLARMREKTRQLLVNASEKNLIVQWVIRGERDLFDSLDVDRIVDDLASRAETADGEGDQKFVAHQVRRDFVDDDSQIEPAPDENGLFKEYLELLHAGGTPSQDTLHTLIGRSRISEKSWKDTLHFLSRKCDPLAVAKQAERLGRNWLAEDFEGNGGHEAE